MTHDRKPYPSDTSDDEWSLVVPHLSLKTEEAPQREYPLRELFNALRSTPESGARAGYDGAKRKRGSKVHMAVDTLGHLAGRAHHTRNVGDREEVDRLAEAIQDVTGENVSLAYAD